MIKGASVFENQRGGKLSAQVTAYRTIFGRGGAIALIPRAGLISIAIGCSLQAAAWAENAPGKPTPAAVAAQDSRSDTMENVRTVVRSAIDRGVIPGAVVYVSQAGRPLLVEACGQADRDRPMTTDAIFRIASMSKPITSVAVMMLVEEGKIGLDDSLSRHLPEYADVRVVGVQNGKSAAPERPVTIRDLLAHISGIAYGLNPPEALKSRFRDAELADGLNRRDPLLADNIRKLAQIPLAHQPGAAFTYGMNTDVLGRVVEVAAGMPFDRFLRERIFIPLRMADTAFFVAGDKQSRLAAIYRPVASARAGRVEKVESDPETVGDMTFSAGRVLAPPKYLSGGAGLVSTAADYARFLTALLRGGELDGRRLLRAESVRAMTTNQIGTLNCAYPIHGDKFGLGFGLTTKPGAVASPGSYSWGGIYHTFFWVDPERELVGVLMTQLYPWGDSTLWADFQKSVYAALGNAQDAGEPAETGKKSSARAAGRDVPIDDSRAKSSAVVVSDETLFGDMDCLVISTPAAKYYYGKRGAGFARILDPDGHDWISYRHGGQAAGEYRGLPKSGQPVKYFHCGYGFGQYASTNPFRTSFTQVGPAHVRVESETEDGAAASVWDFYPAHATFTLQSIPGDRYWFLYEGTPGGRFDVGDDFSIRPGRRKLSLAEPWSEVVPWAAFGAIESPYALLCVNHQGHSPGDSYVRWPYAPDAEGRQNQMTVFGFGRPGWQSPDQHAPQLTGLPARFTIALAKADAIEALAGQLSKSVEPAAPEPGFKSLFDGKTLAKWEGDPKFWRVDEGAIIGETTTDRQPTDNKNTFLIYRGGEFTDFELRFRYKVQGFNSGMQYRSVDRGQFHVDGLQADFEARWHGDPGALRDRFSGMFFEENGRMFMAQRGEAVIVRSNPQDPKKPKIEKIASLGDPDELERVIRRDDWNDYTIIADGNAFTHIINGRVQSLAIDEDQANFRKSGILALQLHAGKPMKIEVREVRIRDLPKQ
jgi:CubicO group peptidase (beta-lactamase class C family)